MKEILRKYQMTIVKIGFFIQNFNFKMSVSSVKNHNKTKTGDFENHYVYWRNLRVGKNYRGCSRIGKESRKVKLTNTKCTLSPDPL